MGFTTINHRLTINRNTHLLMFIYIYCYKMFKLQRYLEIAKSWLMDTSVDWFGGDTHYWFIGDYRIQSLMGIHIDQPV